MLPAAQLAQQAHSRDVPRDDAQGEAPRHHLGGATDAYWHLGSGLLRGAPHPVVGGPRSAHGQEPSSTAPPHGVGSRAAAGIRAVNELRPVAGALAQTLRPTTPIHRVGVISTLHCG